jgi:hypothetical protein
VVGGEANLQGVKHYRRRLRGDFFLIGLTSGKNCDKKEDKTKSITIASSQSSLRIAMLFEEGKVKLGQVTRLTILTIA